MKIVFKIAVLSFLALSCTSSKSNDSNKLDYNTATEASEAADSSYNDSLIIEQNRVPDIDNDKVPNIIEEILGFDPTKRDSDGDGINDYDEIQRGSFGKNKNISINPKYDNDRDGIPNLIEELIGTNPNDAIASYKGGWPTNPNKENIVEPASPANCPGDIGCACTKPSDCNNENCLSTTKGSFCHPKKGSRFPRFKLEDQFGDIVDFYDFANQGKPILLEISAQWCDPCNDFSAWIHSNNNKVFDYQWWRPEFSGIRDIILDNKVQYVNVQYECDDKEGFTNSQCLRSWYNKYPTDGVPVLGDFDQKLFEWVKANGMPVFFLIDENMDLINFSNRGMGTSFDILLNRYK